jgi:alpha-glucoside transport system permease protein
VSVDRSTIATRQDPAPPRRGRRDLGPYVTVALFLTPALLVLGALLVYPILFTIVRSSFDADGDTFVGLANYVHIFTESRTLIAVRNNLIWVVLVPAVVTSLGLVFAVLAQRVAWAVAFRMVLFAPLVVSGLAAGVTFRFIYAADPEVGAANALLQSVAHLVQPPGPYPRARPSQDDRFELRDGALVLLEPVQTGEAVGLGLIGIPPFELPETATLAEPSAPAAGTVSGTVWLDFSPQGERGRVDEGERGLPGVDVEVLAGDAVVGRATTVGDGTFVVGGLDPGAYRVRLAASTFQPPWGGLAWLGPLLITPAIILAYIWIHTGFAVIIISAGLSGVDENVQSAARVEGANEWQVFRFVTVPLLRPVLMVVLVTTIISVLKIFDLVLVIAPESVQHTANVVALEMWRASFGGARDFGLGSALATVLLLMIVPAMLFNLRRFRMEGS